jgi:hypothetical protein
MSEKQKSKGIRIRIISIDIPAEAFKGLGMFPAKIIEGMGAGAGEFLAEKMYKDEKKAKK